MPRTILLLFLLAAAAFGRARTAGYCQDGGKPVVTNSLNSVTQVQKSFPSCTINVYYTGGAAGFVTTSGTAVTLAAGTPFNANSGWTGLGITINSVLYTISTVNSTTSITLTTSAGVQATAVAYSMPATAPAMIFSDNAGTPKTNSFTASATGYWFFYSDDGTYDVRFSGGGIGTPYTWSAISAADPFVTPTGGVPTPIGPQSKNCPYDVMYASLALAIANIPAYGCLNIVGTYTLVNGITISSSNVALYFQPGSLIMTGGNLTPFTVGGTYVTLESPTIDGRYSQSGWTGLGIEVSGTNHVNIDRPSIINTGGYGIWVLSSFYVNIRGGAISGTRSDSVYIQDTSNNVLIDGLTADGTTGVSGTHTIGAHTQTIGAVMSNITVQNCHLTCGTNSCIEVGNFISASAYNTVSNPTNIRSLNNDLTFNSSGSASGLSYQLVDSGTVDGNLLNVGGYVTSFAGYEFVITAHLSITNNKSVNCAAGGDCGIILNSAGAQGARNGGLAGSWSTVDGNDVQGTIRLQNQYTGANNSYNTISNNKVTIPASLVSIGAIQLFNNGVSGIISHNSITGNKLLSNGIQTGNTGCMTNENYTGAAQVDDENIWTGNHAKGCPYIFSIYAVGSSNNYVANNFMDASIVSGTYTSGGSITGSSTQTCLLTFPSGSYGTFPGDGTLTATVALTGSNVIAGGTALTITNGGGGFTAPITSGTLSSGTATCSGTAMITTVLSMGNTFGSAYEFAAPTANIISAGTAKPTCVTGVGLDGTGGVDCSSLITTNSTPYTGDIALDASGTPTASSTMFTMTVPAGAFKNRPFCTFSGDYTFNDTNLMAWVQYNRASTTTSLIWYVTNGQTLVAGHHYWFSYTCPQN